MRLAMREVTPETSASRASSRVRRGPSRTFSRTSAAFLDDDAAAMRIPAPRSASMKRSASSYALNSPASISATTFCCLVRA